MPMPARAAILAEAQTLSVRSYAEPCLDLLYTRNRMIGHIAEGMIWFNDHNTELCQAVWRAYLDALESERPRSGFTSETTFVAYVARELTGNGWYCQREVRTPYGRIDLLAQRDTDVWIVEAKLAMDGPAMTCVLGQLLCSHEIYPEAGLWFATPAPIRQRWATLLARYAIHILEGPWTPPMESK